jgi:hypothetical protein
MQFGMTRKMQCWDPPRHACHMMNAQEAVATQCGCSLLGSTGGPGAALAHNLHVNHHTAGSDSTQLWHPQYATNAVQAQSQQI